jgi:tetratricopeptide (TPR) repeat protein/tRNA A-37 threonylcarbamoyl transferase component Bud32
MSPERWAELRRIFGDALELPAAQRQAFASQACAGDTELLDELQRLLASHEQTGQILDHPVAPARVVQAPGFGRALFQPGDIVADRYRIVKMLGSGGMGDVYQAFDTVLNCDVALKSLRPEIMNDSVAAARLRREVQTARQVTHPNVCRIYDLVRHERAHLPAIEFVSMELLHGRTLQSMLADSGPLAPHEAMPLIRGIVHGLAAAHNAGIVHRDLKSANVLLDQTGGGPSRIVIMDFGLASGSTGSSQSQTVTGPLAGTPAYMAPEQFEGHRATPRSDIYSLGVIVYETVTGHHPFEAESAIGLALKRLTEDPVSPRTYAPTLPMAWEHAILRCLAMEPEARFGRAEDVLAALETPPRFLWARRMRGSVAAIRTPRRLAAALMALLLVAVFVGWLALTAFPYQPDPEALRWYQRGMSSLSDGIFSAAAAQFESATKISGDYALAHARLAQVLDQLDHGNAARQAMLTALAAARETRLSGRDQMLVEALHRGFAREEARSVALFRDLVENAPEQDRVQALLDLGRACFLADAACAIDAYERVIDFDPELPAGHYRLASLLARSGDAGRAQVESDRALELYERLDNYSGVVEVLLLQAEMLTRQALVDEARQKLDRALEIAKATDNSAQQVRTLLHLSVLRRNQGDSNAAEQLALEATELAESKQLETTLAQGLIDLGNSFLVSGVLDTAEKHFKEALRYARVFGGRRAEARALISLASLRVQQRRPSEARPFLEPALKYYKEAAFDRQYRQGLMILARLETLEGSAEAAIRTLRELVRSAQNRSNPSELAEAHGRLGNELLKIERYAEAARELAAAQVNSGPNRGTAMHYESLRAQALSYLGEAQQAQTALASLRGALASLEKKPGNVEAAILRSELVQSIVAADSRKAATIAKTLLAAEDSNFGKANSYYYLALASLLGGRADEAAAALHSAQELAATFGDLPLNARLRHLNAWLLRLQGKHSAGADEALNASREASAAALVETAWLACQVAVQAQRSAGESDSNSQACESAWAALSQQLGPHVSSFLSRPDIRLRVPQ